MHRRFSDLGVNAFLQNLLECYERIVTSHGVFLVVPQMVVCGKKYANNVGVWGCSHFAANNFSRRTQIILETLAGQQGARVTVIGVPQAAAAARPDR